MKLKHLAAAYEAALGYDYCPDEDEAVEYSKEVVTHFTEDNFRQGAIMCQGRSPSEIVDEIIEEISSMHGSSVYEQIINRFGREVQINKIQEEALELALVLNQMNCPTKGDLTEELYGELADMKIMMAQAEILFDKDRIDKMVDFKLNRFKEKYL